MTRVMGRSLVGIPFLVGISYLPQSTPCCNQKAMGTSYLDCVAITCSESPRLQISPTKKPRTMLLSSEASTTSTSRGMATAKSNGPQTVRALSQLPLPVRP
ncbi:hypothetical protein AMTR_s00112p00138010 [Amborella trichopoda]|uniref:Secreted protein n=1 Tax=Amborella trichopoda TaxID=13333 RepID=W1NWW1_AMBTC|nr:hypothetical protein AMTR_s00112p00138010 [Amborella trichopoda]